MTMNSATYDRLIGTAEMGAKAKDALTHAEYAGDPTNNVVPTHAGKMCHDTTNDDWYIAHGTAAADWKIFAT